MTSSFAPGVQLVRRPEPSNSPGLWATGEVQAIKDGKPAGFLFINYIPRDRYEKCYPTQLDKLACVLHERSLLHLDKTSTLDDLHTGLFVGMQLLGQSDQAQRVHQELTTHALALEALSKMRDLLWRDRAQAMFEFETFHIDRPTVYKIEVPYEFQRQGIGRALYMEAAQWLGEQGLALYASITQTPAAKSIWAGLARDGLAHLDVSGSHERFCLNVGKGIAPALSPPRAPRRGPG